jgi:hypothetical protein
MLCHEILPVVTKVTMSDINERTQTVLHCSILSLFPVEGLVLTRFTRFGIVPVFECVNVLNSFRTAFLCLICPRKQDLLNIPYAENVHISKSLYLILYQFILTDRF